MRSSRFGLAWLVTALVIASLPGLVALARAQAVRLEIHPVQTITLTTEKFLTGTKEGNPATISGELRIPTLGTDRLPAVILVHGAAGVGGNVDRWAQELNQIGVAAFILDTFTGRGITDQSQLDSLAMLYDTYRVLDILAKHPRVDRDRIAVMGFSKGGVTALYASLKRFQRMWGTPGVEFAAYLPVYAPCNTKYLEDEDVSNRPIRLFHGVADNWVLIAPCQAYVERLRHSGRDVKLFAYPDATHIFDIFFLKAPLNLPQAKTGRRCQLEERSPGKIVNRDSGQPFTLDDPCVERGTTAAYNPQAAAQAMKDVREFLTAAFHLK